MPANIKSVKRQKDLHITGTVRWEDDMTASAGAIIQIFSAIGGEGLLGTGRTDKVGRYSIRIKEKKFSGSLKRITAAYIVVLSRTKKILKTTGITPLKPHVERCDINISLPADARSLHLPVRVKLRPKTIFGPFRLDAERAAKASPNIVLTIARALVNPRLKKKDIDRIAALSPDLVPNRHVRHTLCQTEILETIDALVKMKKWPRQVALDVDHILAMREFGFAEETYECPNFIITYQTSGTAAVDPDTSSQDVIDPGTAPPVVLTTLPSGDPPTYIKRVCFWLERALNAYTSPPFNLLNPAASGKIPVVINSSPYGSASPTGTFYLNNALPPDLLCAVAVHELFHMVQYEYGGSGTWRQSVFEGGAVFAEDTAADLMNRYLDEVATNFNGIGVMSNPNISLESASYKCSLFWRYVAEAQSADLTEPFVGVETYRKVIEECSSGTYSTADVKKAIRSLPWYQDFYEFHYLDPARLDLTNSETTFGNYVLACYLKDLGTNVPDQRFDFIEDEENIYIDDVLHAMDPSLPIQDTLASVALSGTGTITPTTSVSFSDSVNRFASRYYEVMVNADVTNIEITYDPATGLTSQIFQIALIDEDDNVRDIHRIDKNGYTKMITNLIKGKRLSRMLIAVSGADSSGSFSVSAEPTKPACDVMVTRWHTVMKKEYEIDSRNWAWTWVSPDIWVDNDGNGIADSEVYFNYNNKLYIRLHNKGNLSASDIQVNFYYQDASGGLSHTAWLPVQNRTGTTQVLTGLSLAAGASDSWSVDWSPMSSGVSKHFCIKAVLTVPGDPNTDNKRVLSNFGNVIVKPGMFVDISILRRVLINLNRRVALRVVPRFKHDFEISLRDLHLEEDIVLQPNEVLIDVIRIFHRKLGPKTLKLIKKDTPWALARRNPTRRPDPRGYYKTDSRTLPPGVADRPMITITHEVDGMPLGGATFMVTVEKGRKKKPRSSH